MTANKLYILELYRGIEAESREKMNSSIEEEKAQIASTGAQSGLINSLPARDCPYCSAQMNTSLFSALNSHIRSMHPDRYLEFRTTKWSETTVICERCKFGSELPVNAWQSSHTIKKCNENIACYKKYESKNISFEEPVREDELVCPNCTQKNNGVKDSVGIIALKMKILKKKMKIYICKMFFYNPGGAYKDGPENIFFAKVDGPE